LTLFFLALPISLTGLLSLPLSPSLSSSSSFCWDFLEDCFFLSSLPEPSSSVVAFLDFEELFLGVFFLVSSSSSSVSEIDFLDLFDPVYHNINSF
jgi:hypothetical protein